MGAPHFFSEPDGEPAHQPRFDGADPSHEESAMTDETDKGQIQGEGDYISARKFDAEEAAFAKSGKVEKAAREARDALDGPDAEELEAARESTGRGETGKPS